MKAKKIQKDVYVGEILTSLKEIGITATKTPLGEIKIIIHPTVRKKKLSISTTIKDTEVDYQFAVALSDERVAKNEN